MLCVRPLRDGDVRTVLSVFERLGEGSRRARFNGPKPRLPASELRRQGIVCRLMMSARPSAMSHNAPGDVEQRYGFARRLQPFLVGPRTRPTRTTRPPRSESHPPTHAPSTSPPRTATPIRSVELRSVREPSCSPEGMGGTPKRDSHGVTSRVARLRVAIGARQCPNETTHRSSRAPAPAGQHTNHERQERSGRRISSESARDRRWETSSSLPESVHATR